MHQRRDLKADADGIAGFAGADAWIYCADAVMGLKAHSLALLSEAGHNLSDFLALLLSFVAVYFQTRPATHEKLLDTRERGYWRRSSMQAR